MGRLIKAIIIGAVFFLAACPAVYAQEISVSINGSQAEGFVVVEGSVYVNEALLANYLGIGESQCDCGSTYLSRGNSELTVKPDLTIITSEETALSRKAVRISDELMYPLRSICEYYGVDISWNESARAVSVVTREFMVLTGEGQYALVLDVRSPEEYAAGHLDNATNLPFSELQGQLDVLETYKDRPVLVYCKSGKRSAQAVDKLLEAGFTQIYHLFKGYESLRPGE